MVALHWARREHTVAAVASFDYGAKHNHREIPCAAEQAAAMGVRHEVIRLDFVDRLFASDLLKSGGEIPEVEGTSRRKQFLFANELQMH